MGLSLDDCGLSNFTLAIADYIFFGSHRVLLPIYLVVGLAGNITLLVAFWKKSKVEQPYAYQMILTISKTLEIWCFGTFMIGIRWLDGSYTEPAQWYLRNVFFVYCTRIGASLHMLFIINSLLCSV